MSEKKRNIDKAAAQKEFFEAIEEFVDAKVYALNEKVNASPDDSCAGIASFGKIEAAKERLKKAIETL